MNSTYSRTLSKKKSERSEDISQLKSEVARSRPTTEAINIHLGLLYADFYNQNINYTRTWADAATPFLPVCETRLPLQVSSCSIG